MDHPWKSAVRKADKCGAASSGRLNDFDRIRFWKQGHNWMFRDENGEVSRINVWKDIPVNTIHFKTESRARYAKMNARDETVVEELTKSIMRGDVKIDGSHACVNNIGNPPVPGCHRITPDVPVPIMPLGDPIYARISKTRVTRGSDAWYIHTAFIETSTGPGGGRSKMQRNRIYMCGESNEHEL